MNKAVNLYLVSCVNDGIGFWLIDFSDDDVILNSVNSKLLECYRKEIFGVAAAIEVKYAINTTLDILSLNLNIERYKLDSSNNGYSYEIPLNTIEDIFDLWAYNYHDEILWKKYIGLLKFRSKFNTSNNYINIGLKGKSYEFAVKLDKLLSFKPSHLSVRTDKYNDLMW